MAVICPHCGAQNRPLAKFCMKCVTPLSTPQVDRAEDALPDALADIGDTATLRVPRTAEWAADSEAGPGRAEFGEFAEHALPDGTLIEGFRIIRSIGEGGFGIVYLAWDAALERHVAIKEYMPTSLAVRANPSLEVSMRSDRHRGTFDAGLKSFVNEARLLARFDHPALVKVFRFWEANRTAYMAMPFYEGPTLKATLADGRGIVSEAQLRAWLEPLLDALAVLHREQCYHRDISPDNILLTASGPVLLDFGAARRVISDMTQVLTAVLKPGFAPIEQYGGELQQGPWTDLYALAGVVHYAITGRAPTASVVRVVSDTLKPLAVTQAGKYSENFLRAIDAALSVRPEARPQDVAGFRALLDAGEAPMPMVLTKASDVSSTSGTLDALDRSDELPRTVAADRLDTPPRVESSAPGSVETSIAAQDAMDEPAADDVPRSERGAPQATYAPRRSSNRVYLLAAVCLLVAGSLIWWTRGGGPSSPGAVAATAAMPPAAASPGASSPSPSQTTVPQPTSVAAAPATPAPPTSTALAAPIAVTTVAATSAPPPAAAAPAPRPAVRTAPPSIAERAKPIAVVASVDEPRTASRAEAESAPVHKTGIRPQRCADIIQKSSLDTLSADEVAYLKKECR